jgi:uncharacterized protein (TIGR00369 family)
MNTQDENDIPSGYTYTPSLSAFVNHVGRIYRKVVETANGDVETWSALRVQAHHVNAWKLCHGAVMASLAEISVSAAAYEADGPPVVIVDLSLQFLRAPKLGDLIEVCATVSRRTRSMVFARSQAMVGGELVFTASGVQKIVGS